MNTEKPTLKTVYGPHPSRCYGKVIYIDPVLPPKKCPYDCVFCPLGKSVVKTRKPSIHVDSKHIVDDLKEFIEDNMVEFDKIIIWGYGDPLLNYQIPIIISNVKEFLEKNGYKSKILIKTSGLLLLENWVLPLYELVDEIILQLSIPGTLWRAYHNPPQDIKFHELIKRLAMIDKRYRKKISIELILFKINTFKNFDEQVLLELITAYKRIGVNKVYVSTIDRPPTNSNVKPVHGKILLKVNAKLVDEGFNTTICSYSSTRGKSIKNTTKWLYNHLLRIPLSTREIVDIYGDQGITVLDRFINDKMVEKINWEHQIYFKIKQQVLMIPR